MINSLSIVLPLYNEEKRLPKLFNQIKKFSNKQKYNIEFIFVDDGSIDKSFALLVKFKKESLKEIKIKIITYKRNKGKGYAIKTGVLSSKNEWVLTMDIDLSVSFNQINTWVSKKLIVKGNYIFFGSRAVKGSKTIAKKYRIFTGTIFNFLLRLIIKKNFLKINDTQCGFKLYNKKIIKNIFKNIKEYGYIHDVEILIIIRKNEYIVNELPVNWLHQEGSKINIIRDSVKMFFDLIKLKLRHKL
jgi:dolichyl-phosphate beta-glucosyltransferase